MEATLVKCLTFMIALLVTTVNGTVFEALSKLTLDRGCVTVLYQLTWRDVKVLYSTYMYMFSERKQMSLTMTLTVMC